MKRTLIALLLMMPLLAVPGRVFAGTPDPAPTPFTWIEVTAGSDHLNNGSPDWHDTSVTVASRAGRRSMYGTAGSLQRFGKSDSQYTLGAYFPAGSATEFNLEFSASPTHRVLPSADLLLNLDHRVAGGWGYALSVRGRQYPGLSVSTEGVSVDRYWRSFRAAYTLSGTQISNASGNALGHGFLFTKFYGQDDASNITLRLNAGREAENIGGPVLVSTVAAVGLAGVHWFSGNTSAVSWSGSVTRQGNLYTRSEFQLGFRHRL